MLQRIVGQGGLPLDRPNSVDSRATAIFSTSITRWRAKGRRSSYLLVHAAMAVGGSSVDAGAAADVGGGHG